MMQDDKSLLESFVEKDARVVQLEQVVQERDALIESLREEILSRDMLKLPSMCPSEYSSRVLTSSNTAATFVLYSATPVLVSAVFLKKLKSLIFFSYIITSI